MSITNALEQLSEQPETDAYLASDLERDSETRHRLMKLLGSLAVEKVANTEAEAAQQASLYQVAEDYISQDPEKAANAQTRLENDFRTNVFEILCASGHVSLSYSVFKSDGFYQNGYSQRAMYAHGTLHAANDIVNQHRTIETLNELRIEDGFLDERFATHYFVEVSRVPDGLPIKLAERYGYNTETWKVMLRCTEVDDMGRRLSASASVSGVDKKGNRYDQRGAQNIYDKYQLKPIDSQSRGTLESAFWVEKSSLPNRVVSLAQTFDDMPAANEPSFFGVQGGYGNYDTVVEESLKREQQAEAHMDSKVQALAQAIRLNPDADPLKIMAIHAKNFAAELCSKDNSYDPAQFGPVAARHLEEARYYAMVGDEAKSAQALDSAQRTAIVYMCGMRLDAEGEAGTTPENSDTNSSKNCDYISKECPLCKKRNARTHETAKKIECLECRGSVTKK